MARSVARHAPQWNRQSAIAAGLLLLLVIAYLPAIRGDFIWDDDKYVSENPHLRSIGGLGKIWTELGATPQYYPLVFTTFWLEYHLFGPSPWHFHGFNVLCHAGTALLLWRILKRLSIPGAGLAAAIFAFHPVHVESVAWITERKNVLSGLLYMGSLLSYCRFSGLGEPQDDGNRSWTRYLVSGALFVLALLSKTVTCSLPAAILLILWWKRGRIPKIDVLAVTPMILIGLALGRVTAYVETHFVGARGPEWEFTIIDRCLIAGRAIWFYAQKLVWPADLTFIYPRWNVADRGGLAYAYPVAALCVVFLLWVMRRRLGRGPLVTALYFGGTLLPALGFVNVYPMRFSFVADHFLYLASIGLIVLLVGSALALFTGPLRAGRPAAGTAAIVIVGALAVLTWRQSHIYRGIEALYLDTLRKNPQAWMAHNNLAGHFLKEVLYKKTPPSDISKRLDQAVYHAEQAINLRPETSFAHRNLGIARAQQGRFREAEESLMKALRLDPDDLEARTNLGNVQLEQGRPLKAIELYRHVLRVVPNDRMAAGNLNIAQIRWRLECMTLANKGREAEAIAQLKMGLELCPDDADAHYALGELLARQGLRAQGKASLREALRLNPGHAQARRSLEKLSPRSTP